MHKSDFQTYNHTGTLKGYKFTVTLWIQVYDFCQLALNGQHTHIRWFYDWFPCHSTNVVSKLSIATLFYCSSTVHYPQIFYVLSTLVLYKFTLVDKLHTVGWRVIPTKTWLLLGDYIHQIQCNLAVIIRDIENLNAWYWTWPVPCVFECSWQLHSCITHT